MGSSDVNLTVLPVVMVMVPLPAQGHLNQLLNLSRLVSSRGVPVHYVGSARHNLQAKIRVHGWEPSSMSNIHFHDFPLPTMVAPSPDPHAPNFADHLVQCFESTIGLREPLAALLQTLSTQARRVVVVHDSLMSFAAKEVLLIPNSEAYAFRSVSAMAILFYTWEALGKPSDGEIVMPDDVQYLSSEDCFTQAFTKFAAGQHEYMKHVAGYVYNTCRPIESRFIDLLAQEKLLGEKKQWAFGPFNPVVTIIHGDGEGRHECLRWLDKQPRNSVLYVSFGTMTSISDEQLTEIAMGLERSEQRFVWVVREADRTDIFAEEKQSHTHGRIIELPDGYEERIQRTGMIVRDWAPQLEILAHPATGGFLSHCGWNSCMESFSTGVPIAAWPMHSDQPWNTVLVTQVLRTGLVVRDWARRKELLPSSDVESAMRKLMGSEEGESTRTRAEELRIAVREAISEGGSSTQELDAFINHISR